MTLKTLNNVLECILYALLALGLGFQVPRSDRRAADSIDSRCGIPGTSALREP